MDEMADALPLEQLREVLDRMRGSAILDPAMDIPRILKRLAANENAGIIDSLLPRSEGPWEPRKWEDPISGLAPLLSPSLASRLWETWGRGTAGPYDAEALSVLVGRLPEGERATAVDEVLAACAPILGRDSLSEERILGRLARSASTDRLTHVLRELLAPDRRSVKRWPSLPRACPARY